MSDEYLSTFCPILSHAVLSPAVLEEAEEEPQQTVLQLNEAPKTAAPKTKQRNAEYIGCQGPNCAFFLRGENRCCIPLLTQATGIMLAHKLGQLPQTH